MDYACIAYTEGICLSAWSLAYIFGCIGLYMALYRNIVDNESMRTGPDLNLIMPWLVKMWGPESWDKFSDNVRKLAMNWALQQYAYLPLLPDLRRMNLVLPICRCTLCIGLWTQHSYTYCASADFNVSTTFLSQCYLLKFLVEMSHWWYTGNINIT